MVEKHFILDKSIGGPDAAFSMTKDDFAKLVQSIRSTEKAMGDIVYPTDHAQINGRQFCRSLYVAENIKAGELITEQNVRSVRPGFGLHPKYLNELLGKKVTQDLTKGTPMKLEYVR